MKKLLILIVIAFTINTNAQESTLLRLNHKKGDAYVTTMKMSQDMGDVMSMDISITMNTDITESSKDTYVSKMKISSISMDMNQGGMNMSYDSSKSDDELDATGKMIKAQMGPMLQAVITVKGNNLGEIIETSVEPNIPGTSDLTNQTNNVVYPKKALRVGDSWTMKKEEKGMVIDFVYTVKSIASATILLNVTGEVSGNATGTVVGTMDVDKKSGMPLVSKIDMDLTSQGQALTTKMVATTVRK
ncbi:DUF6263 family protein [Polaribacter gochangensis]|uniref:DUF6263 family protein n=1 Tax=Polaribacter gochangensis TaxID=3252903 RepID=UPI0039049D5E